MSESEVHELHREVVETRQYVVELTNGELETGTHSDLMSFEERSTVECACGERFVKDERAIEHLKENDAIDAVRAKSGEWDW